MSMICSISQSIPKEPVLSPVSGCIFEKKLIKKYISEFNKDPIADKPLKEDQLIEIRATPKTIEPLIPSITSIPDTLIQLRDEWDACMLDSFELKQQLMMTRQELSHALYQLDSSYRVIARLQDQVSELSSILGLEEE